MFYKVHEIGKRFYLLRSDEPDFHRNIYVKIFKNGNKTVNMIMDPGSRLDLEPLTNSLEELIGGIDKIDIIFLSHQDPDVSSLTPLLLSIAQKAIVLTSQDTIRLIKMYGIPENRLKSVEDLKSETVKIKDTGHRIKIIHAYFCHFRGAIMCYDIESKVLFTGDFMGGLNTVEGKPVYATEKAWDGILLFHTIYMPSNLALRKTIDRIGLLNPFPEAIAPQHGYVVKSDLVVEFMSRLSQLNVGMDLLTSKEPTHEQFLLAINDFKEKVKKDYPDIYPKIYDRIRAPGSFTSPFIMKGDEIVQTKILPSDALSFVLNVLEDETEGPELSKLKTLLLLSLEKFNVSHLLHMLPPEDVNGKPLDISDIFGEE